MASASKAPQRIRDRGKCPDDAVFLSAYNPDFQEVEWRELAGRPLYAWDYGADCWRLVEASNA